MPFGRCQISLDNANLIPADTVMNVLHFETSGTLAAAAADMTAVIEDFYSSLGDFWSTELAGSGHIKWYDLGDATPRVPVYEADFTFPVETDGLPAECAVCLSFNGAPASGTAAGRNRGRIYLGPCAKGVAAIVSDDIRVAGTFTSNIATAATAFLIAAASVDAFWSVFSPTTAGPEPWSGPDLSAAFKTVVGGYVDNAFDTQRRRGPKASTRVTWAD